jgi:hypothetical protein
MNVQPLCKLDGVLEQFLERKAERNDENKNEG